MSQLERPVVYAISGYKNSGKTTLCEQVVELLTSQGYRVAVIKHDGHDFEPDVPGTDSYRHRKAGAVSNAVFSDHKVMITMEQPADPEQFWDERRIMALFYDCDFVILEGFKNSDWPKYFCKYPEVIPDPQAVVDEILAYRKNNKEN